MVAQECQIVPDSARMGQRQSPVSYLCTVFREKQWKSLYIIARNGKKRKSMIPLYRIFALPFKTQHIGSAASRTEHPSGTKMQPSLEKCGKDLQILFLFRIFARFLHAER